MCKEFILAEFRKASGGVVPYDGEDCEVVVVGRIGEALGGVDASDVGPDEVGNVVAHPAVFHYGNEARHEKDDGYRTEAQD